MPFPVTARYFLDFRNSDTGLTPTFVFLQTTPGFAATSPASPAGGIVEKSNGRYYFDWIWTAKTDADIVFEVDGGASIPTEEVRYIKGTISPRDRFLDEPVSQVVDDVWTDSTAYAAGQKGKRVDDVGAPADSSVVATVFGKALLYKESIRGDTAGTSDGNDVEQVFDAVGTVQTDITDIKGAGFATGTDSLKIISDNVDSINVETDAASIADAVWDASTGGNIGGGTMGGLVNTAASGSAPSAATVAAAVWDEATTTHVIDGSFGQTLQLLNYGLAQAGAASTITLVATANSTNEFYTKALIVITAGLGVGQARAITAYAGGTRIATVDRPWVTNPDATSRYMILPASGTSVDNASIADAVWDEAIAGHLTAGSTGNKLNSGSGGGGVSFLSNGDTVNPIIISVASPTHTTVKITFSEPVVMTTGANGALNLGNYSIPSLTLIAVASLTSQQVLLTTSAQTPNFLYTLSIINVEDLVGNPIL